jgi:hypothetical protein
LPSIFKKFSYIQIVKKLVSHLEGTFTRNTVAPLLLSSFTHLTTTARIL